MTKKILKVEANRLEIDIDNLIEYDKNNKIHGNKQIDAIANSINRFSYYDEIVIDKNNVIIAGHGRLEAIKKLGYDAVEVKQLDIDSKEAGAMRILDNLLNRFDTKDDFENIAFDLDTGVDLTLGDIGIDDLMPELSAPEYNPDDYLNELENQEELNDGSLKVEFRLPNPEHIEQVKDILKQFDVEVIKY